MILRTVILVAALASNACCMNLPFVAPFFFLCNYPGGPDQSSLDTNELSLGVRIEGHPEYYVPGNFYRGK